MGIAVSSYSILAANLGLTVNVSMPAGNFARVAEGDGWTGNFARGEGLLRTCDPTGNYFGPLTIITDNQRHLGWATAHLNRDPARPQSSRGI